MIKSNFEYYKLGNTNYESDGNVALKPSSSKVKVELNGMCEMTLTHPYDKEGRWRFLENQDGVIKAPTPWSDGQLFVIYSSEKKLTGIEVSAYHIFFDLNYSRIDDRRAVNKTGQEALDILLEGTKYKGHSDITDLNTAYWVKLFRVAAINGDNENSFINRWGGEVFFNNFDVYVNSHIGGDYGASVTYGINMQDLGIKRDMQSVVTRVYPQAADGIELPEKYIDSPLINNYRIIKEGNLDCSDLKLKDSETASESDDGFNTKEELYAAMRKRVQDAFESGLDKPSVSGTTKVAPLENTTKYKSIKNLVSIGLGDTVTVYHEDLNINSTTRCVGYEWNQISRKFIDVTLGEIEKTCFDEASDTSIKLDDILNKNGTINVDKIVGVLNAAKTKFKAMRDIAQPQQVRAMLFEDKVPDSPTYGALCLGSAGFEIASERTDDDKDWNWRTFGTGKGFVADCIVAGVLKSVLIQNLDGSFKLDLSKTGGCKFFANETLAMEILKNGLNFYGSNANKFGVIGTYKTWDGIERLGLNHERGKQLCIGYNTDYGFYPYVRFNIDRTDGRKPVYFSSDTEFSNVFIGDARVLRNLFFGNNEGNISLASNTEGSGIACTGAFGVDGDLNVMGDKNCIQQTSEGNIRFSATEDLNALLTYTDIDNVYKTTANKDGTYGVAISIKNIEHGLLQECINTELPYLVEIYKEDLGDIAVTRKEKNYFIVKSDRPIKFRWCLKGRRVGFEYRTLSGEMVSIEEQQKKKYQERYRKRLIKQYSKLWQQCADEWQEYGMCFEG